MTSGHRCLIHTPFTNVIEMYAAWAPAWYHRFEGSFPDWSQKIVAGGLRALARRPSAQAAASRREIRLASWANMVKAKQMGLCRKIGVSNYPMQLMKELEDSTEPVYNEQQELHPVAQFRLLQDLTKPKPIRDHLDLMGN